MREYTLGIIGGGQLCRMMLPECHKLNIKTWVMDKKDAPAAEVTPFFIEGSPVNEDDVLALGEKVDVLTMDLENVNTSALYKLRDRGVDLHPSAEIIEMIQDKGRQKDFLQKQGFPTSTYYHLDSSHQLRDYENKLPLVQKKKRGGYDGKGVHIIRDKEDFNQAFSSPSILEEMVDIEKELSCLVVRNKRGQMTTFPCTEMVFHPDGNLLDHLICPAMISPEQENQMREIAYEMAEEFQLCGVLAVEYFLSKNDSILVNELAPRPHNSGHHTIEGCSLSQFELHIRGVLNLPIRQPLLSQTSFMWNLLGKGTGIPFVYGLEKVMEMPSVHLHLYGKKTVSPGRKMGHVTIVVDSRKEGYKILNKIKNI